MRPTPTWQSPRPQGRQVLASRVLETSCFAEGVGRGVGTINWLYLPPTCLSDCGEWGGVGHPRGGGRAHGIWKWTGLSVLDAAAAHLNRHGVVGRFSSCPNSGDLRFNQQWLTGVSHTFLKLSGLAKISVIQPWLHVAQYNPSCEKRRWCLQTVFSSSIKKNL